MAIWRMRSACWITRAKDTYLEYETFFTFLRQNWLRERVLMLRSYVHRSIVYMKMSRYDADGVLIGLCWTAFRRTVVRLQLRTKFSLPQHIPTG